MVIKCALVFYLYNLYHYGYFRLVTLRPFDVQDSPYFSDTYGHVFP